jgi:hypothetical protein
VAKYGVTGNHRSVASWIVEWTISFADEADRVLGMPRRGQHQQLTTRSPDNFAVCERRRFAAQLRERCTDWGPGHPREAVCPFRVVRMMVCEQY